MAKGNYNPTPPHNIKRRMTRIVVSDLSADECQATIDDSRVIGKPGKKIGWLVEDQCGTCTGGKDWHIELEFDRPWNHGRDQIIKVDRDDFETVKVHKETPPTGSATPLTYDVYIVIHRFPHPDIRKKLIDPELEIAP